MAVKGAKKVDGVDDPNLPVGKPIGGLGLAAAAVSFIYLYNTLLILFSLFLDQACSDSC